jgi:hypothetical protein
MIILTETQHQDQQASGERVPRELRIVAHTGHDHLKPESICEHQKMNRARACRSLDLVFSRHETHKTLLAGSSEQPFYYEPR